MGEEEEEIPYYEVEEILETDKNQEEHKYLIKLKDNPEKTLWISEGELLDSKILVKMNENPIDVQKTEESNANDEDIKPKIQIHEIRYGRGKGDVYIKTEKGVYKKTFKQTINLYPVPLIEYIEKIIKEQK